MLFLNLGSIIINNIRELIYKANNDNLRLLV